MNMLASLFSGLKTGGMSRGAGGVSSRVKSSFASLKQGFFGSKNAVNLTKSPPNNTAPDKWADVTAPRGQLLSQALAFPGVRVPSLLQRQQSQQVSTVPASAFWQEVR